MIFMTGDKHGAHDIHDLNTENFPEQKGLTKQDYVFVTGDFGLVWNNNKEDRYWQKWLHEKSFTTLWIDGNHENFDLLDTYPVTQWNGGKVHMINDSLIHLMRGQIYTIDGKSFFTFGGALSIDKGLRKVGQSWWEQEIPNQQEMEEGLRNLEKHHWNVDYIVTHDCPTSAYLKMSRFMTLYGITTNLNSYFDNIEAMVQFKHWYYGHYHRDEVVDEKHTLLYHKKIKLQEEK